ncbi:MAG: hypothetical protein ABIN24_14560 [Dyadobacter sp.]
MNSGNFYGGQRKNLVPFLSVALDQSKPGDCNKTLIIDRNNYKEKFALLNQPIRINTNFATISDSVEVAWFQNKNTGNTYGFFEMNKPNFFLIAQ